MAWRGGDQFVVGRRKLSQPGRLALEPARELASGQDHGLVSAPLPVVDRAQGLRAHLQEGADGEPPSVSQNRKDILNTRGRLGIARHRVGQGLRIVAQLIQLDELGDLVVENRRSDRIRREIAITLRIIGDLDQVFHPHDARHGAGGDRPEPRFRLDLRSPEVVHLRSRRSRWNGDRPLSL
jgi:hypothetical protein